MMTLKSNLSGFVALIVFLFVLPPLASAAVLTVGPSGDFQVIQPAVDAAQDRDVILVSPGTYAGFVIDNKTISVTGDGPSVSVIGGIDIQNLAAGRYAVLNGLDCSCEEIHNRDTLIIQDNIGSVRIEECKIEGFGTFSSYMVRKGVHVELSKDVVFSQCYMVGGSSEFQYTGKSAIMSEYSKVVLYDCQLQGGSGGDGVSSSYAGGEGGSGYDCIGSFLFVSNSTIKGGEGGDGGDVYYYDPYGWTTKGGDGGDGLAISGTSSEVWLLDTTCMGGDGGSGGYNYGYGGSSPPGDDGQDISMNGGQCIELQESARTLEMASPIREFETIRLNFEGTPGDQAYLILGVEPQWHSLIDLFGPWLVSFYPVIQYVPMGPVNPLGLLSFATTIPALPPGMTDCTFFLQSVFADSSGMGHLGSPRTLIVLDENY